MRKLFGVLAALSLSAAVHAADSSLESKIQGTWKLVSVTCAGKAQKIEGIDYTLSFNETKGEYVSKTKDCTQTEPEEYTYPSANKLTLKSGIRACAPNPCAADLAADQCGKETNTKTVPFDVAIKNKGQTLVLKTNAPEAVDCIGPGQKKPAVFTFKK